MTTSQGPTAVAERAVGPDLARGLMLLFIALANSHYFLRGPSVLGGFPQDGSGIDRVVTWVIATFVDGRAFPMFGLLFGYGVAQLVRRQSGTAWAIRFLLWRRSLVLVVLGFLHAMLLYVGDILGAYGVLLFIGVWAIRWKDRWLLAVALVVLALTALPGDSSLSISADPPDRSMLPPDFGTQLAERIVVHPFIALLGPIGFAAPFLIGLWAGRRRILERPAEHLRLLRITAVAGVAFAVVGAQPVALMLARTIAKPTGDTLSLIGPLHDVSGMLGGLGYAALIVLAARRLRRGRVVAAVAATGQRSLTFYLAQSVVWAVVFTPYLLDLSDELTITTTALLATATWLTTVWVADRMRRAGHRGPFEVLVRRITYGSAATADRRSDGVSARPEAGR
ncbi:DUF418 domain-containing protein [Kribbella flavida]|uniref:DUF418 domain-containing protein n=1 Tax=Kribbella flavida TaxID=182640 RepID=UPI001ED92880|nr:DUF418 domain-containing protein [Kribbella flavida]